MSFPIFAAEIRKLALTYPNNNIYRNVYNAAEVALRDTPESVVSLDVSLLETLKTDPRVGDTYVWAGQHRTIVEVDSAIKIQSRNGVTYYIDRSFFENNKKTTTNIRLVSRNDSQQLKEEIRQLKDALNAARVEKAALASNNAAIADNIRNLTAEKHNLLARIEGLSRSNSTLRDRIAELIEENDSLKAHRGFKIFEDSAQHWYLTPTKAWYLSKRPELRKEWREVANEKINMYSYGGMYPNDRELPLNEALAFLVGNPLPAGVK